MLWGKKKKIAAYIKENGHAPFALLLEDWISGEMKKSLEAKGFSEIEIHVDFLPDYKCIGIQARAGKEFFDIQAEESVFHIAKGEDEPEYIQEYPLISKDCFYAEIYKQKN